LSGLYKARRFGVLPESKDLLVGFSRVCSLRRFVVQRALSGVGRLVAIVTVETLFLSLHGPRSRAFRNLLGLLEVRTNAGNSGADGDSLVDRTISLLSTITHQ
jgi:hypothetical protein